MESREQGAIATPLTNAEKLAEIIRLHDEAFSNAMKYDGHCKSSDGYVAVHFGTVHDRRDADQIGEAHVRGVEIYAYVLGPSRTHYFDSLDAALTAMRDWHTAEMTHVYGEEF